MKTLIKIVCLPLVATVVVATGAQAEERNVTLKVGNMFCAACPYIVERTLESVDGVVKADVSYGTKTAAVTYEDSLTTLAHITVATAQIGYPLALLEIPTNDIDRQ